MPGEPAQDMDMGDQGEEPNDVDMHFIGSCELHDDLGTLQPEFDDSVSHLLLTQMGSSGRSYKRDFTRAAKQIVSEIYSPPRVTALIKQLRSRHFLPGYAFDLTTTDPEDGLPWDFSIAAKRERARKLLREQKPYLLVGSTMCTAFCTWQALNYARSNDRAGMARAYAEAVLHMNFVAELYAEQVAGGRYFLHEHPDRASSWQLECIRDVLGLPNVQRVTGDQCMYGAQIQSGPDRGEPVNKPTGFMTNSDELARVLNTRCTGQGGMCSRPAGGKHVHCSGKHAREAAKYPRGLCKAIHRGIRNQLRADNLLKNGCFGVQVPDEDAEVEQNLRGPAQGFSGRYKDDLTGQVLHDESVRAARAKELDYFCSKGVWKKMPQNVARSLTGRAPISVRWVDVNKGDDLNPNYRSRLVARQLKALDKSGDSFFAPAPPLEALRTVLSLTMTKIGDHVPDWDGASSTRCQISLVDIKRAYFNAKVDPRDPRPLSSCQKRTLTLVLCARGYCGTCTARGWRPTAGRRSIALSSSA